MEHISKSLPQNSKTLTLANPLDEPVYNCSICKDFGKVHPIDDGGRMIYSELIPCRCQKDDVKKARMERLLKVCDLPSGTEHMTFKNFDAYNPSLKEALKAAKELADPDGELQWLTIVGGVDVGKSHLSVAICRRQVELGLSARYVFVPTMLDDLRRGYSDNAEGSFQRKMDFLLCVPLLVLDDLGTQKPTDWAMEKLVSIINSRYESGYPLVVTTNKPLDELPGDDENRIASRLMRFVAGKVVVIDASEYRLRGKDDT